MSAEMRRNFRSSVLIGAVLLISGVAHLLLLIATGADWAGPLSLRKPALFGISGGLTVWSLVWTLTKLKPHHRDKAFGHLLSTALLIEVTLITVQRWRGVPSHFNHSTTMDAAIEATMLVLILFVTVGIAWLCVRADQMRPIPESLALAIRAGLWFLLVSCGLGLLTTILGEVNMARGRPPELWGLAGILKYPHGATIHAIQTLPILSSFLQRFRIPSPVSVVRIAVGAQILLLIHALWQTLAGRARFDVDLAGFTVVLLAACALTVAFWRRTGPGNTTSAIWKTES